MTSTATLCWRRRQHSRRGAENAEPAGAEGFADRLRAALLVSLRRGAAAALQRTNRPCAWLESEIMVTVAVQTLSRETPEQ
ncbi:MAG: hypothetical protein ACLTOI_10155 [Faecalibacterium sp.]